MHTKTTKMHYSVELLENVIIIFKSTYKQPESHKCSCRLL